MSAALVALALVPLLGAALPGLARARARGRNALASAAVVLGVTIALDAYLLLATPPGSATVLGWPWVPALDLTLALRFDRLGGATALLIELAGLFSVWRLYRGADGDSARGSRAGLVVLFTGLAQAVALAENALLVVAFVTLGALVAFVLEADRTDAAGDADGSACAALYARSAGSLALLAGILLIADTTGSFEFGTLLALAASIRGESLYPLLVALVLAGAWSRPAAWPWIRRPRPRAARGDSAGGLTGVVLLATGIYLTIRLWPLLGGALPRTVVALGFVATPLLVAALERAGRALGASDEADAPAPPVAGGGAHE